MASDYRNSSDETADVMARLRDARLARGYTWHAVASMIESEYGYRITEDQYRACEQGLTRKVPLDVVIYAARVLDLEGPDVFGGIL